MQDRIDIGGFTVCFEEDSSGSLVITEVLGNESRLTIPDMIDTDKGQMIIGSIGKKAFMGKSLLRSISLPGTIKELGDWAFAQCSHLNTFIVRGCKDEVVNIEFGRGVFEDCHLLEAVCIGYEQVDARAIMLGAAVWRLPAAYLFMSPDMGQSSWYESWDRSLRGFLEQRDDEGYTDRVLCGEEDISYDGIGSVDGELLSDGVDYIRETRKRKCHLCLTRLKWDDCLEEISRDIFIEYLKNRDIATSGQEAWIVLKDSFGDNIEYFKLYADIGALKYEDIDAMLEDLGDQHAEAKAFLIKYKKENQSDDDFFDDLVL